MNRSKRPFDCGKAQQLFQAFAYNRKEHVASGILVRRRTSGAHLCQYGGGGIAFDNRNGNNAAAGGFDFFPADNLIPGPIAAFDEYIGQKRGDDFARRQFVENDDGVHTLEGRKNFCSFELRQNGPARAFQFAHAGIAVDANDKGIAKGASLFEALNMSRMQKVEAAIGEN